MSGKGWAGFLPCADCCRVDPEGKGKYFILGAREEGGVRKMGEVCLE